jgi:hypothetical protein
MRVVTGILPGVVIDCIVATSSFRQMNYPRQLSLGRHPRMSSSGVQVWSRLDFRLMHTGMTDFGNNISFTQHAAGN